MSTTIETPGLSITFTEGGWFNGPAFQRKLGEIRVSGDATALVGLWAEVTQQFASCVADLQAAGIAPAPNSNGLTLAVTDYAALLPKLATPRQVVPAVAPLCITHLADAFQVLEGLDHLVGAIMLNPRDFADLRKFARDDIDFETSAVLLREGLMGKIWGAHLIIHRDVPAGRVLVVSATLSGDSEPVWAEIQVTR